MKSKILIGLSSSSALSYLLFIYIYIVDNYDNYMTFIQENTILAIFSGGSFGFCMLTFVFIAQKYSKSFDDNNVGGMINNHPTQQQIRSVCFSYRHDFDLLNKHEQEEIATSARQWWIAISKEVNER